MQDNSNEGYMLNKKYLAIGTSDFKSIIDDNCYYFDKTKFIEKLIEDKTKVKLFTRPRRFGKTLNMTTLKYFFDVKNKEEHKTLFKGLYIEQSPLFKKQGQHPVLFISFKDLKSNNWDECYEEIQILFRELFKEYLDIFPALNEDNQELFNMYRKETATIANLKRALSFLSEIVSKHYGEKVILLIDEYDTPIISAHQYGYYDEAINFFKTLLSTALKDNPYLEMAVLTGIVRVANENIFSGLNNIKVYTILDEKYEDAFGLTELEVTQSLEHFEMKESIDEVKAWYNGYKFGDYDIYNPWSITNYLADKKVEVYWINTSGNYLIKKALKIAESGIFDELKLLLNGESIKKHIDKKTSFIDMNAELVSWQLLFFSGYLTIDEKIDKQKYALKLTNYEVRDYFNEQFINVNFGRNLNFRNMMDALIEENFIDFEKYLGKIMMSTIAPIDTRKDELIYHMYVLGTMAYLTDRYIVNSNEWTGKGRSDISLEPRDKNGTGFILEFKVAKDEKEFNDLPKKALEQIKNNKYHTNLEERGIKKITAVALVFYGKEVRVEVEKI